MTPEQEAEFALTYGVDRSDLPESAQLAYDRLAEERNRAAPAPPASRADAEPSSSRITVPLSRRMLPSIVLATIGIVLGIISLNLYLISSPGSLVVPSNVVITVKSSVPISRIDYVDNAGVDDIAEVTISIEGSSAHPAGTASVTVTWPNTTMLVSLRRGVGTGSCQGCTYHGGVNKSEYNFSARYHKSGLIC
jgi:hypothetical protein